MARKVYVSSDISLDDELADVAEIDPLCALLWPWFLTTFDDWGRSESSPKRLKRQVFPENTLITADIIEKALILFNTYQLIKLYSVDGKQYMAVDPEKWFKYQTHIRSEKREKDKSKCPPPSDDDGTSAQQREITRCYAEVSAVAGNCIPSPSPSLSPSPSPSKDSSSSEMDEYDNPFRMYERERFGMLTSSISEKIGALIDDYTELWVRKAMEEAAYYEKRSLPYVNSILEDWKKLSHPEPWTIERKQKSDDKVRPFNSKQQRGNNGRGKPIIPVVTDKPGNHKTLSDEEMDAIIRKAEGWRDKTPV